MAYEVKNEFIDKGLENEIAAAIKERRSIEQLLAQKKFVGTNENLEELTHILIKYMGINMALEFILFTANQDEWEKYRGILVNLWEHIAETEGFKTEHRLLLGQSLYQKGQTELGAQFIRKAAVNAADVKTTLAVAEVVNHEIKNKAWVREVLLGAKEIAKTADDYTKIAKGFSELAQDETESKKTINEGVKVANTFTEYCEIASAILKLYNDVACAELVFEAGTAKKDASSPLDTLAEEEYSETLAKY
ncbi:MAG: hypothetical protein FWF51_10015 [Chitinivibrionia bacterium]|nr:hypothetical protein [Chitinivibrionia bacterium]